MAENLENLLNRIQKEGVEKAEAEAAKIIEKAREQASLIVKESEAEAKEILEKAERDARVFAEQSIKTMEHAGRDVLITVGNGINNLLKEIAFHSVGEALSPDTLIQMMIKIATAYADKGFAEGRINMLLSPEDQKTVVKLFMEKYREQFQKGIEIHVDDKIVKGFKVAIKSDNVFHDFTQEAIADSICYFLKPYLAEIIHRVANTLVKED
ncbi:MAG: hypothetical protein E3K37_10100 [Candidatus Kuenenia sp.]|nr:hypothetical protein [Candidatus Kuenenia hertensis]